MLKDERLFIAEVAADFLRRWSATSASIGRSKIDRPDRDSATDIFELYLDGVPLNNGYTVRDLSEMGSSELFSKSRVLYEVELRDGEMVKLTLANLANGGMVAGIVDQATSIAMHRDIECGQPEGLRQEDLVEAVDTVFRQNLDLNHNDELADFTHDFREEVVGIRRRRQAAAA